MSLTTTQSLFKYAIASLGQAFTPACAVQNTSDFVLTFTDATTFLDTALTLNVDYTVAGAPTNGVILSPTITLEGTGLHYVVGGSLTIQRKNPFTQPTVYVDGVKYLAAVPNNSLDWLCYSIQAINDILARCLRLPASAAAQAELVYADRVSRLLGLDASGNFGYYNYPSTPGAATNLVVNNNIVGPTGGGASHLDGIDASSYAIGTIIKFTLVGIGLGPTQEYQLTTSAIATGPGVVAALNVSSARWIQVL